MDFKKGEQPSKNSISKSSQALPVTIIVIQYKTKKYELFSVLNSVGLSATKEQKKGIEDLMAGNAKMIGFK